MRKPIGDYKMIAFDASDTLIAIPASQDILRAYLAERSIYLDGELIGEQLTEALRLFYYERKLDSYEECTPESDRAYWVSIYQYVLHLFGLEDIWSEEQILQASHQLYDIYTAPRHYELFEDVVETLERLSRNGFRLGLISNFSPTLRDILKSKGIEHYFEVIIVSTEVGLEKPDPGIFKLFLELTKLDAQDILYVGDHELNDIWAPGQAGIDAIRINRYDHRAFDGIHSLREL